MLHDYSKSKQAIAGRPARHTAVACNARFLTTYIGYPKSLTITAQWRQQQSINQSSFSLSSSATTSDTEGTPMEFSCFCRMPAQCSAVQPETTCRSDLDCRWQITTAAHAPGPLVRWMSPVPVPLHSTDNHGRIYKDATCTSRPCKS